MIYDIWKYCVIGPQQTNEKLLLLLLFYFPSTVKIGYFLADRTIGRAFGTVSRLSVVCLSVCSSSVRL